MTPESSTKADWSWTKPVKPFAKSRNAAQNAQTSLIKTREELFNQTFSPVSTSIRDMALKPVDFTGAAAAGRRAGGLFDVGMGALEREQRALGVGPMAGQAERTSLRRTLAEVDAANRKFDADEGLRDFAQRASAEEYADRMAGAGGIYGQIADMELNRKGQYKMAQASRDAGIMSMVGTAAGMAMAV